jgi:hypothetical protein
MNGINNLQDDIMNYAIIIQRLGNKVKGLMIGNLVLKPMP